MAHLSDRLDRLQGLLASRQSWTGVALAREMRVSLRTVRRDLVRLGDRGVPIESERGRGGGVRVPVRTGLGRLQLDHREVLDLLLSLAIGERLQSPLLLSSLRGLRQKIGAAFPPEERLRVARLRERILHGPPASQRISGGMGRPRPAVIRVVQDGFFEQRSLEIAYAAAEDERTTRVVEPHYLMLTWPVWYLVVWDHLRAAPRTLRLDRIESARMTEATFMLRKAKDLVPWAEPVFAAV